MKWEVEKGNREKPLHISLSILAAAFEVCVTDDTLRQLTEAAKGLEPEWVEFEHPMPGLLA